MVQAVGIDANGTATIPSAPATVATPSIAQPVVASATPLNPTTAAVDITPPTNGGPWTSYNVTLCPTPAGNGSCVTATCSDPKNCVVPGLQPGTTYAATVSEASEAACIEDARSCACMMPQLGSCAVL